MRKVNRVVWNIGASEYVIKHFDGPPLDDIEKAMLWSMFEGTRKHLKIGDVFKWDVPQFKRRAILERIYRLTYTYILEDLEPEN
jgi:hypothetical protein